MFLRCCLAVKLHGFSFVLPHAVALGVTIPKFILRFGMSFIGRLAKPLPGFIHFRFHVQAMGIATAEFILSLDMSLIRRLMIEPVPKVAFLQKS
jgi:hypothetical protein